MGKLKSIFRNSRIIILLIFLLLSIYAIQPNPFVKGVAIRSITPNSSASIAGIENPKPTLPPMSRERIISIDNIPIEDLDDYYSIINRLTYNQTFIIKTNKKTYTLRSKPLYNVTVLPELVPVTVNKTEQVNVNGTLVNRTVQETIYVNKTINKVIGVEPIGLSVYLAPTSNIRKGLDLAGGTRVILKPEEKLNESDFEMLLANLKQRLNVFGLSDIVVRKATDLSGDNYILVEIAGAKKDEVKTLLSRQGKFEGKVGNYTVFIGGKRDITYVCRSAQCSGIDPYKGCGQTRDGAWVCAFRFAISLSPDAAKRMADATKNLDVLPAQNGEEYLSKDLELYLDDKLVDKLRISASLRGKPETSIAISGSGLGNTEREAAYNAIQNMKQLQTILITGSLPTKLDVAEMTSISPTLGKGFVRNALTVALLAIVAVFAVVYLRYRKLVIAIPILITLLSEMIIVLGFAALIGWNLDLSAIAGMIIVIGTSVDHQIVIADEILRGESRKGYSLTERIKKAFFIIMGAYFTTVVAVIPLMWTGAGLLRGFALTTIVGVTIGVFITRPAFAAMTEVLLRE